MRKTIKTIICIFCIIGITAAFCSCSSPNYAVPGDPVKDHVTVEAGTGVPDISEFLEKGFEGEFMSDMSEVSDIPGVYEVEISVDGKSYVSFLIVDDSKAPAGEVKMLQIKPGTEITADDFFVSKDDATDVTAVFLDEQPDTSQPCACDVRIALVDSSLNQAEFSSRLIVSELDPVTVEARADALDVRELTDAPGAVLSEPDFIPDTVGMYEVGVKINGKENITVLTVEDTTPPTADPKELVSWTKHDIPPENLVDNAFDFSEITYSYKETPDFENEGTQNVTVILTDACNNSTEVTSVLTLNHDTEAPVLYGINEELYLPLEGTISYFKDVYAEDNADSMEDIKIDVDKSTVDIFTIGDYEVTYTATDISGNSSQKTTILKVVEKSDVTEEMFNEIIQKTLAEITTEDMTMGEKAFAIYNYVRDKVVYNGESDKTDYMGEAYRGLTEFKGDCFTFYASTDALLKAIGAETMKVSREPNATRPTHHYWVKCNLGTGWYHIDTTNTGPRNYEAFMRTDDAFLSRAPTYWLFDRHKYPESPKTDYVKDWLEDKADD